MIILREFKPGDFDLITDPIEPFCSMKDDGKTSAKGVALTGIDGDAMACAGVMYTSDTEGIIWLKMSCKCKENAFMWARTVREGFKLLINSVDVKVYTYILDGFYPGERLAKSLGLEKTIKTRELNGNIYYKYVVA